MSQQQLRFGIFTPVFLVLLVAAAWGLLNRFQSGVVLVEKWSVPLAAAAAEFGHEDPYLLAGLVYAESRGKATAVSSVGALGLCQLMPSTAEELAARYQVDGPPFSPEDNLRMGAAYWKELLRQKKGDVDLALLSYRLGSTRVSRELKKYGSKEAWVKMMEASKKTPWHYRSQILEYAQIFRQRAQEGEPAWSHVGS